LGVLLLLLPVVVVVRIGGVVVVVDSLTEHAKKNSFHTRKKIRFLMTTRVRSWLTYLEDAPFLICF
jgi:hypothetical protein